MKRRYRGAVGILAVAGLALTSAFALAAGDERIGQEGSESQGGALDAYCPDDRPCAVLDVDAGERSGERTLGEDLADHGKAPSECPEAVEVIHDHRRPIDAFIGRCPTPQEAAELAAAAPGPQRVDRIKRRQGGVGR